jgi:hypothetical protein
MKDAKNKETFVKDICLALNKKGYQKKVIPVNGEYEDYSANFYLTQDTLDPVKYLLMDLRGEPGHWRYLQSQNLINRGFCPYCGETPIDDSFNFTVYGYSIDICKTCMEDGKRKQTENRKCYIATVCYGNENSDEVITLKWYRDMVLVNRPLGRLFISWYYSVSPQLAKLMDGKTRLNLTIKKYILKPIVSSIIKKYSK